MHRSYFFVRHGRAVYQSRGFDPRSYPPGTDWPLAPIGHEQAKAVRGPLLARGIERVVSSGLTRARQTAGHIAQRSGERPLPYAHRWPALDELDPKTLRHAGGRRPEWLDALGMAHAMRRLGRRTGSWEVTPVAERIDDVLRRLDALPERRVAVVGHGFWIWMLAVKLGGPPRLRWIQNTSVTRVDADGRGDYRLVSFARPL